MSTDWAAKAQSIDLRVRHFIGGRWQEAGHGELLRKYSPRDGRLLCEFAAGEPQDVDAAVASARRRTDCLPGCIARTEDRAGGDQPMGGRARA